MLLTVSQVIRDDRPVTRASCPCIVLHPAITAAFIKDPMYNNPSHIMIRKLKSHNIISKGVPLDR